MPGKNLSQRVIRNEKVYSWTLLIILSVIWGSSYILIKKGLTSFTPLQVGTIRISFAFLFLIPFALKNLKSADKSKWKILFVTGMLGNLIPAILFAIAQTNVESSLAGILNGMTPLFTLIIAVTFFKYKITLIQIIGLLTGFIGTASLSFINSDGMFGSVNYFTLCIVAATVCYAFSLMFIKTHLSEMKTIVVASLSLFTIGPVSMVVLFSTDFFSRLTQTPDALHSLGFICILGIFGTAIALILYAKLIQITSPFFSSSVTYLIPVTAIIWGMIDGEKLYPLHFAAMAMVLAGIYLINKME